MKHGKKINYNIVYYYTTHTFVLNIYLFGINGFNNPNI